MTAETQRDLADPASLESPGAGCKSLAQRRLQRPVPLDSPAPSIGASQGHKPAVRLECMLRWSQ